MGVRDLLKLEGGRYVIRRRMVWGGDVASVGEVIRITDPALARELIGAGKIEPADADAETHMRGPARWVAPRDTSINPKRAGVFARKFSRRWL